MVKEAVESVMGAVISDTHFLSVFQFSPSCGPWAIGFGGNPWFPIFILYKYLQKLA
jgi:hypothetical protein